MIKVTTEHGHTDIEVNGPLPIIIADHACITQALIDGIIEDKSSEDRDKAIDMIVGSMHDNLNKISEILKTKKTSVNKDLKGLADVLRDICEAIENVTNEH